LAANRSSTAEMMRLTSQPGN